jgi:hypothetical protein
MSDAKARKPAIERRFRFVSSETLVQFDGARLETDVPLAHGSLSDHV